MYADVVDALVTGASNVVVALGIIAGLIRATLARNAPRAAVDMAVRADASARRAATCPVGQPDLSDWTADAAALARRFGCWRGRAISGAALAVLGTGLAIPFATIGG